MGWGCGQQGDEGRIKLTWEAGTGRKMQEGPLHPDRKPDVKGGGRGCQGAGVNARVRACGSGRGGVLSPAAGHPSGPRLPSRGGAQAAPWPPRPPRRCAARAPPSPLAPRPPLPAPRTGPSPVPASPGPAVGGRQTAQKSPSPFVPLVGSLGSRLRCLPTAPLETSANTFYFPFNCVNGRKNGVHMHLISRAWGKPSRTLYFPAWTNRLLFYTQLSICNSR